MNTKFPIPARLGTISLVAGAILIFLLVVDPARTAGWSMPTSWYTARPAWFFFACALAVFGLVVLWNADRRDEQSTSAKIAEPVFKTLTIYTRKDCHLCDEVQTILEPFDHALPAPIFVDIDDDAELRERFNTCVPVVEIDGKVRFRGRVDPILLRRLIENAAPMKSA